ncbi:MAG: 30S ribosomal protein S6 [Candidatus Dojkabacteria bacterium]|nr:MAG: 30S ribosomal protein S6 [Candidatus Dojkabacteria bacterium]
MQKHKYELMVIIKPLLPDNVRLGVESKIVEILEKNDGRVHNIDVWGRRHLAYKIKGYNEGYYIVYEFENYPAIIKSTIEKSLRSNSDILRFLLIKQEK